MGCNKQNKLTNKIQTDSEIKKRVTAVRREGFGELREKGEGIKKKISKPQTTAW